MPRRIRVKLALQLTLRTASLVQLSASLRLVRASSSTRTTFRILPKVMFLLSLGDIGIYCVNTWSDVGAYVQSGDLDATVVMADQRNAAYPDVPCTKELGIEHATLGYYRVFTALEGTPARGY